MWKLTNEKMSSDKNRFLTGSDLLNKLDRLEREEGNGKVRKRAERSFGEKRV